MTGTVRRWPLAVIAAPAEVSIWSGWVGLGGLCGFGDVGPLPGILPLHVNTALTLPLGIESYAALALGAWLRPGTQGTARRFARGSALGALALGMLGQVSYHLLAARHATRAPDVVVVLVACLPVVVLGCAVALLHLLSASEARPDTAPASATETAPEPDAVTEPNTLADVPARRTRARTGTARGKRTRSAPVTETDAELHYAPEIAAGALPSQRQIRADLHVGQDRARVLRTHLESLSTSSKIPAPRPIRQERPRGQLQQGGNPSCQHHPYPTTLMPYPLRSSRCTRGQRPHLYPHRRARPSGAPLSPSRCSAPTSARQSGIRPGSHPTTPTTTACAHPRTCCCTSGTRCAAWPYSAPGSSAGGTFPSSTAWSASRSRWAGPVITTRSTRTAKARRPAPPAAGSSPCAASWPSLPRSPG